MKKLLLIITVTMACLTTARAAISVGAGGSGVLTFPTRPTVAEGWSSLSSGGAATTFTSVGTFDAAVPTNLASTIVTQVGQSATVNPPSDNGLFRWNSVNLYLQSRPTGNAYSMLLATLSNDSGGDISTITVAYDYGVEVTNTMTVPSPSPIVEDIPGHQVFWSLTGAANSWTLIPGLSGVTSPSNGLSAVINVGTWPAGSTMYLLWADDNGPGGNAQPGNQEGVYTIDNFSVSIGGVITENVTIVTPTNNATFAAGVPITINASAVLNGTISDVAFYHDGILIGTDTSAPYSVTYSNATLGAHTLVAVSTDNTHSVTSAVINITVNPNTPPSVTLTEPVAGTNVLVGTTINTAATATDSDGSVVQVEFYVDGVLKWTDTTSGYTYQYGDSLAGTHTISAVAVDSVGGRATNSTSVTVTNQPGVTIIVTNGSSWKYFEGGADPGATWFTLGYNDSGWSNGVAELGYGDTDANRPEATMIGFGGNANLKYAAAYFRKTFTVADPTAFSSLVVRVLRDDHAIVRLNGNIIYNDMTNDLGSINFQTYEQPQASDDGNVYQTYITNNVLVAGLNILAVEVHQNTTNSSDISFDLMLWGTAPLGPTLTITPISATQADISWPVSADPAQLYFKNDLNNPTWTLDTTLGTVSGGFHHVTVSTTGGMRYWTLRL